MASIRVTVEIDDREFSRGLDHLAVLLKAYTADASMDAAQTVETITRGKLVERSHGPLTFSPSPAGSPPAMVSGALAASISHAPDGATGAMVGPTGGYGVRDTSFYARIQEEGGDMYGHPYMKFIKAYEGLGPNFSLSKDGTHYHYHDTHVYRRFELEHVDLEARPYLKPAVEMATDHGAGGRVRDIYAQWWADAIRAGAG